MNPEIQAILSGHNLPPSTPLSALPAHLTGDELSRVHHLLKYPNEQTEPKGGRVRMELSKWKKDINYMTDREIVQYYGQLWGNVKHLKSYVEELRQRYMNELYGGER
jgi:hypothetical protein